MSENPILSATRQAEDAEGEDDDGDQHLEQREAARAAAGAVHEQAPTLVCGRPERSTEMQRGDTSA